MKRILLIFLLKCSLLCAQNNTYFGLKMGVNRSQVLADGYNGYNKTGFNGGVFSQWPLRKNCTIQIEVIFNDKGSKYNKNNPTPFPYNIRLYYIDCPFLFQIDRKKIIYEFGLGIGYLVDQAEYHENRGFHDVINYFSKIEKNFNLGLGYPINEKWNLNLRYNNSIVPIRKVPSAQFNSVFTLAFYYRINFKKTNNTKSILREYT